MNNLRIAFDIFSLCVDVTVEGSLEKRGIIAIEIPPDADPGLVHNNSNSGKLKYEFDHIFDEHASQEKIFSSIVSDKIHEVFEGINCTVFAYGQTGSGKTYSMCGGDSYKDRGIIPRSLELVFREANNRLKSLKSFSFKCNISFCEIYKEIVYDLLHPERKLHDPIASWPVVEVMESASGMTMRNLSVYNISTVDDAMQLYFMGNSNRMTASTSMNDASSRSHAVFTIVIASECVKGDNTILSSGKINLVDLAGSERVFKVHIMLILDFIFLLLD
jgi:kinesin family protein 6/9